MPTVRDLKDEFASLFPGFNTQGTHTHAVHNALTGLFVVMHRLGDSALSRWREVNDIDSLVILTSEQCTILRNEMNVIKSQLS
jgi:hypothetical protein